MKSVLIVDDSPVQRRVIGNLFEATNEFEVSFAEDGADGLTQIAKCQPDLVVTDLEMPNKNGLELVEAVRATQPLLPVILVTARGSEEIAAEALRVGAASYVPKAILRQYLLETANSVLQVYGGQRAEKELLGRMRRSQYEFALENDRGLLSPLVNFLLENLQRVGLCDEADQMRLGIALTEALTNALIHGNLEVSSELRQEDDGAYYDLIRERTGQSPYQERRVHIDAELSPERFMVCIRDEGPGFDTSTLPDPTDPTNLDRPSGRGVMLMRTFVDEVQYNDRGNQVTMIKAGQK